MVFGQKINLFKLASLMATLLIAFQIGCSGDKSENDSTANTKQGGTNEPTSVTPSSTTDQSPADRATMMPSMDDGPKVTCQTFLAMLKTDHIKAQRLLTKTASAITHSAELELKSIGNASAIYKIAEPRYATNKQKMAYVDVAIVEQIDGNDVTSMITWLVKKKPEGWRISGMMLELKDSRKDLLSFENANDVAQINQMVGKSGPAAKQADANNANQK